MDGWMEEWAVYFWETGVMGMGTGTGTERASMQAYSPHRRRLSMLGLVTTTRTSYSDDKFSAFRGINVP